ncbi:hypothetical protein [Thioclava kandeliae]|uniref:Uncharacterized protein n=1 Tax=Thioclava kandeliae TaxID=3070818 RepID=A0ABV1SN52_9RHOB
MSIARPATLGLGVWLQLGLLGTLIAGAVLGLSQLKALSGALAVLWIATQWGRLLPLARVFAGLAGAALLCVSLLTPERAPALYTAVIQGTGFAALMMVLGLLRQPVKRAAITQAAARTLLSVPPKRRYGALLVGAQFMALMFNVGIIAMIGDLTRRSEKDADGAAAMVIAAMRGAALVSIWSPMSLGFAIVTAGVANVPALPLVGLASCFTVAVMAVTTRFPLLPAAARLGGASTDTRDPRAIAAVLAIAAALLGVSIALHHTSGLSFTLCAVIVLPCFAFLWLALETEAGPQRFTQALGALGDLRNEGALFLSANVIGAALSLAIQSSPLWAVLSGAGFASLPTLLILLVLIPLAAALYLPNSIMVVLAAQIFGASALGQAHPLALGLTLCIGWALAICVNPISAMNLIVARFCNVSAAHVAHRWNLRFVLVCGAMGACLLALVYSLGG